MSGERFCALSEANFGNVSQWPRDIEYLTIAIIDPIRGFDRNQTADIISRAADQWSAVCGMRFLVVAHDVAHCNIRVFSKPMDGQNGKLAEAQLPYPGIRENDVLGLWFDSHEVWTLSSNPPRGKMDALRVACHELGHNLGIGHAPQNIPALMAPTVSSIREPQTWDAEKVVFRYGPPAAAPKPDPGPKPKPEPGDPPVQGKLLSKLLSVLIEKLLSEEFLERIIEKILDSILDGLSSSEKAELVSALRAESEQD